jgi:hypothetical protein
MPLRDVALGLPQSAASPARTRITGDKLREFVALLTPQERAYLHQALNVDHTGTTVQVAETTVQIGKDAVRVLRNAARAPDATPVAAATTRAARTRPRERRERRHQQRSTSSSDPGDPDPPRPANAERAA